MNANVIINMIVRTVLRRVINVGVNAGIDAVAGKGKAPRDMTPAERAQSDQARKTVRQARQMMRVGRRIGRL